MCVFAHTCIWVGVSNCLTEFVSWACHLEWPWGAGSPQRPHCRGEESHCGLIGTAHVPCLWPGERRRGASLPRWGPGTLRPCLGGAAERPGPGAGHLLPTACASTGRDRCRGVFPKPLDGCLYFPSLKSSRQAKNVNFN